MKRNHIYNISALIAVFLCIIFMGSAFAGSSSANSGEKNKKNYAKIEGVLSIKEGHGEFLVRLPDGKAQRFSLKKGAEITITRNGQPARYSELKVRDSIQVQYDGSTREIVAIHANKP